MINTDVLDRAVLLAGPHARRHGDWLGATLEFDLREGSRDRSGLRAAVSGTPDDLRLAAARNQVRLPAYSRLDLRATRVFTYERARLTLFLEVMNALGRRNYGQADGSIRGSLQAVGYVEKLIPRVPSAGFLLEF